MQLSTGTDNIAIGHPAIGLNALPSLLPGYSHRISIGPGAHATRDHEMVVATEHGFIVGDCRHGDPVRPRGDAPRLRSFAWHLGARLMVWASASC